jgi:hypothetical protein
MKTRILAFGALLAVSLVIGSQAQDKADVRMEQAQPFHAGGPISFTVKLNEPLPKGARFDFRISPVTADEEINLGSGEPIGDTTTEFRVSGKLPEGALPGEWHISVIYLFLPGASWTRNTIAPNDLRFKVEGKPYSIPTKAAVTVER